MPRDEAESAFRASGAPLEVAHARPRFLVADVALDEATVLATLSRLGLTHDASEALFAAPPEMPTLEAAARDVTWGRGVSFQVRAERVEPGGPSRMRVEADVGAALMGGRRIDLRAPQSTVRAFLERERVWVGRQLWDRDPKETAARHVKNRPVGSPVSLPPKTARALVNLAQVAPGGRIYDPFCGTGGVLLEAASMGYEVLGSDLDPRMVAATNENLAHFGLRAYATFDADIQDAPDALAARDIPAIDAIVADLPYGRSASTGKERTDTLYARAFSTFAAILPRGRRAVVGVPSQAAVDQAAVDLDVLTVYQVHVHRSLTRHFAVLVAR